MKSVLSVESTVCHIIVIMFLFWTVVSACWVIPGG